MLPINNDDKQYQKFFTHSLYALIILFICRLAALCLVPLNDYSESRYGEIARKMLETNNWVTPLHDYGVPFWAKPPLSTWVSAFSMKLFGVNEFGARLPSLLFSIAVLLLVWSLAKKHSGAVVAWVATLVLAGALFFFLDAGAVMTDPSLLFCTTLCMVSFWRAVVDGERFWSYAFFAGLGLGMLAKGPIAVVLVGAPLFFWVLWRNEWLNLWRKLPWIKGSLLATAIALPWYALAEIRTPGFLNYFIIGEHFNRFVHAGWAGDKYGHAHHQPWGMIWIFAIAGIFPWNILGGAWIIKFRSQLRSIHRSDDGWMSYLLISLLVPLIFFTFASNIIYTYVFPVLPVYALWFAECWCRSQKSVQSLNWVLGFSVLTGLCFLALTGIFMFKPQWVAKTQKDVVYAWIKQHPAPGSSLIFWDHSVDFSAKFYGAGKVAPTRDRVVLCAYLSKYADNYLVIDPNDKAEIPAELWAQFTPLFTETYKDKTRVLMHVPRMIC
jgi:4-amino-4-deoxy-L-arabinose transferase-like glycosyltransferase